MLYIYYVNLNAIKFSIFIYYTLNDNNDLNNCILTLIN